MPDIYTSSFDCEVLGGSGPPPKNAGQCPKRHRLVRCKVPRNAFSTHCLSQNGYSQRSFEDDGGRGCLGSDRLFARHPKRIRTTATLGQTKIPPTQASPLLLNKDDIKHRGHGERDRLLHKKKKVASFYMNYTCSNSHSHTLFSCRKQHCPTTVQGSSHLASTLTHIVSCSYHSPQQFCFFPNPRPGGMRAAIK